MEPFMFSHYPMSTRGKGKRPMTTNQEGEYLQQGNDDDVVPPLHKRQKIALDKNASAAATFTSPVVVPPCMPPPRHKRGYEAAFEEEPSTVEVPPPPRQRCRIVSSSSASSASQSAGQITTESPERLKSGVKAPVVVMNTLLGKLHAERMQRQQQTTTPCPLTQGMNAMSIQTGSNCRKNCISLHTDSKLA